MTFVSPGVGFPPPAGRTEVLKRVAPCARRAHRLGEGPPCRYARFISEEIDLRAAINAVSDVIQNRPRPLREFDQIYMKAGDMVMQSEFIAHWANGKRLAFIGDGDAISVCAVYLQARGILP
jgi:hypothetical protein